MSTIVVVTLKFSLISINFVVNPTVRSIFEEITHAVMDNLIIYC
jgi:hypothetical protein